MKRIITLALAVFLSFGLGVRVVHAQSVTGDIRDTVDGALGIQINGKTGSEITPGDIITGLLPYLFVASGVILLVMLIWGGFEMLMNANDTKAQEAGKHRITAAAIGFVIMFTSIWIGQIAQLVFHITIFGT